ncbi:MAG TPA: ATP-binding protein [Chthoniobacteraceae bacterium]|nr:ATP-binding protein [Opitutaceae bacterium]HWB58076.1 ATP-binding protein [Chthoniobacteraceae bacterium]
MATTEKLPPNFDKLDVAFRSVGYSLESAVADVIDNSIDANARNILVRLIQRNDGALDLAIMDDGEGMSSVRLKEAMRFGSDLTQEIERLGKFGLGLKLASLSQAKELRVVSKAKGAVSGRAWLEDGIKDGFASTMFTEEEAKELLGTLIPDKPMGKKGTLVHWTHLYRIGHHHKDLDEQSEKLATRLQNHLRLAFHRYLSGEAWKIRITIDVYRADTATAGVPYTVKALNPFGYKQTGCRGFPKMFHAKVDGAPRFEMMAHIWPSNSEAPEYKLPGGANGRQGFYFYRNNRLIQAGGWNGLRDTEPHSSLARVAIDLDPEFDLQMSLDVKKSEIHLPPALAATIMDSKSGDEMEFREFLSIANNTYRTRSMTDKELPLVPASGVPMEMREILFKVLRLPQTSRHRKIDFEWKPLEANLVFWVDRDNDTVLLNSRYRKHLLHGLPGSSTDIPAIKCLLFLLAQDAFRSERLGGRIKQRLELANLMLRQAVKHERSTD